MLHDLVSRDLPIAPAQSITAEDKCAGIFLLEHGHGLCFTPAMLDPKHTCAEHIEESVHFRVHFITEHSNRMMQTGGELDRHLTLSRNDQRLGNLRRTRKRISCDTAGAQLKCERSLCIAFPQARDDSRGD